MRLYTFLTFIFICSLVRAQTSATEVKQEAVPLKTQKYNGYGLPNTKFKKVKIDLSKKKPNTNSQDPSIAAPLITLSKTNTQPVNSLTASPQPAPPTPFLTLGLGYDFSYNAQAQKQADNSRAEYLGHEFTPKMILGDFTILGDFIYVDDIKDPSKGDWIDSPIFLSRKAFELGKAFTLSPNTFVLFPLSKDSRENTGLKSGVGAGLTFGLNTKNLGIPQWSILNYQVRYTKLNNEFDTKVDGNPVTAYQIKQRINVAYNFTDAFSFKTRFEYNSNYSAQNVVRNSYLHYEVFNYEFNEHFSANFGHSTGASVYTIHETDNRAYLENDLKFYDPKVSELAVGLGFSI